MRLINTSTYELKVFTGSKIPTYAILSHCWGNDEVTLQEYERSTENSGPRFKKMRDCCSLAVKHGIDWAWIDTYCIDKTSSAELSEAINSMFKWYERSAVCYAFLEDDPEDGDLSSCRWFTRGWTLQELLAPNDVRFYGRHLQYLGDKESLAENIEDITRIHHTYLAGGNRRRPVDNASISLRMSWASQRVTTREEDIAYSLMGIFDINMPLLYGEGSKAFIRLQENIIARSDDESLFCWTGLYDHSVSRSDRRINHTGLLAVSPQGFRHSGDISPAPFSPPRPPYVLTNKGLRFHVARASILQSEADREFASSGMGLQCVHKDGSRVTIDVYDEDDMLYRNPLVRPGRNLYPRGYIETVVMGYRERIISVRPYRDLRHQPGATRGITLVDAVFLIASCLFVQVLMEIVPPVFLLTYGVASIILQPDNPRLRFIENWAAVCLGSYVMFYASCQAGPFLFWTIVISWTCAASVFTGVYKRLSLKQLHIRLSSRQPFALSWLQHRFDLGTPHLVFLPLLCMVLSVLRNIALGRAMLHVPNIIPATGATVELNLFIVAAALVGQYDLIVQVVASSRY